MKLYEQYLQETAAQRVINRVNKEVIDREIELKTECYQRYMVHKSPREYANYQLCLMRAQLQSMRNGLSLSREGIKSCMDKSCKKEVRQYIEKLIDFIKHKSKDYIRKKAVLLL